MTKQTNRQQPFHSWFRWINPPPNQRHVSRLPPSPPQPPSESISPSAASPQSPPPSSSQQPLAHQFKSPSLIDPQGSTSTQPPPTQSETPGSNNLQPPPPSSASSQSQLAQEASSQTSQPQPTATAAQAPSPSPTTPQLHPVISATSQRPSLPHSASQSSSQSQPVPQLPPTQKTSHPLSPPPPLLSLPPSPLPSPPLSPRSSQAQQVTQTGFRTPSPTRNASQSKETAQVDSRLVSEPLPSPSQPKSTAQEKQLELKSASKLANADSQGKTAPAETTAPAEPSAPVNPTQYPKSETKLEELQGNITKGERKQDLTSTSYLKAETDIDEIKRGKSTRKPEPVQETDATQPLRTVEKPEDNKEKPKPKEAPKQDAKALTQVNEDSMEVVDLKQSNEEPDSKSTRIHPHPTHPVKKERISETEQLEKQTMVHKIEPLQKSSTGKETKIAISSRVKGSASHEENDTLQKEIEDGISRLVQNLAIGNSRKPGSEQNINIITLAGDNKGAIMHVGPKLMTKDDSMHIDTGYTIKQEKVEASSDGRRRLEERPRNPANNPSVNSNIQSINNSILQNSSCSAGNPGVHLTISTEQTDTFKLRAKKGSPETYKDVSKTTSMQKLSYEPTIRRRCLRGLFLESDESDQENHQKPRRHGCRYSCEDKKKAKVDQNGSSNTRNVENPS